MGAMTSPSSCCAGQSDLGAMTSSDRLLSISSVDIPPGIPKPPRYPPSLHSRYTPDSQRTIVIVETPYRTELPLSGVPESFHPVYHLLPRLSPNNLGVYLSACGSRELRPAGITSSPLSHSPLLLSSSPSSISVLPCSSSSDIPPSSLISPSASPFGVWKC